jgi:hypothetical protein
MDGVEQLHGHGTVQNLITSQKDAGHASRAQFVLQDEPVCKPDHAREL